MQLGAHTLKDAGKSIQGCAYLYEKLAPFRRPNEGYDTARSVSVHKKRYVTLRPITGGWAFRYHDTDVVIWRENQIDKVEECVVSPWSSLSTETFANAYTPHGVSFKFHYDHGCFAIVKPNEGERRVYDMGDHLALRRDATGTWMPHDHDATATFIDKDPSRMRVALNKTKYHQFSAWLNAVMTFDARAEVERARIEQADEVYRVTDILDLLDDANTWETLRCTSYFRTKGNEHSVTARRETIKAKLREAIYAKFKCIVHKEVAWYPLSQFESQTTLQEGRPSRGR